MAKYREIPCKYYEAFGLCQKGGTPATKPTASTAANMFPGQRFAVSTKRRNFAFIPPSHDTAEKNHRRCTLLPVKSPRPPKSRFSGGSDGSE